MSRSSQAAAEAFAALGDETRLRLVTQLSDGQPRSIVALSERSQLTRQAITKHLRVLERAGIIRSRRVGRESQFVIEPKGVDSLRDYLDTVSKQWDQALERLQAFVESDKKG